MTNHHLDDDAIIRLIGRRVRQLRWARRLSVEDLAARAQLPVDVVRQLEAGELARYQLEGKMVLALADALDVCVVDLLL